MNNLSRFVPRSLQTVQIETDNKVTSQLISFMQPYDTNNPLCFIHGSSREVRKNV
jgi:hypothetical protein